jgi:hypothetical protein
MSAMGCGPVGWREAGASYPGLEIIAKPPYWKSNRRSRSDCRSSVRRKTPHREAGGIYRTEHCRWGEWCLLLRQLARSVSTISGFRWYSLICPSRRCACREVRSRGRDISYRDRAARNGIKIGTDLQSADSLMAYPLVTEEPAATEPGIGVLRGNTPDRDRTNTRP